jgi:hypothetical protein
MIERQISLDGVPELIANAIEVMVQASRQLAKNGADKPRPPAELPVWNLGLKRPLQREDYYDETD